MQMILIEDQNYSSPAGGDGYAGVIVQTGPCYLYGMTATNLSGSTVFVQVFDSLTQPLGGVAPYTQLQVLANSQGSLSKVLPLYRWKFIHGMYIGLSSSGAHYTAVAGPVMLNVFLGQ